MAEGRPDHEFGLERAPTRWERAYEAFETPEQEVQKFLDRFRRIGADGWDRSSRVLEVCSGRGSGLQAWHSLGFTRTIGVDYSVPLIRLSRGAGDRIIGDARNLPLASGSIDIAVVQGGLHHLSSTADVECAISEMCRVVRTNGKIVIIEPWLTPFLQLVHAVAEQGLARRLSGRINALGTMIDEERDTYERWLKTPDEHLAVIRRHITTHLLERRWGKIVIVGSPASQHARANL